MTFLDITGAYDNVDRSILCNILEGEGIGNDCIQLLREIYRKNTVCVEWEGIRREELIYIDKGLRQGCPLSPLLFMMYIVRMERALEGMNIGFNLSYKQAATVVEQQLPGLLYADDIVLLANKQSYMQRLADICGEECEKLGLKFNVKNSGFMVFNENSEQTALIQGQEIPRVKEYKYLGIWVNEGDRYLET